MPRPRPFGLSSILALRDALEVLVEVGERGRAIVRFVFEASDVVAQLGATRKAIRVPHPGQSAADITRSVETKRSLIGSLCRGGVGTRVMREKQQTHR